MPSIFATAGAHVYIGGVLASQTSDFTITDFASESWVEISWVENMGNFGDQSAEITFDAIGENRTLKLKGTRNAGNMDLVCGLVADDAGQLLLRDAETNPDDYAFKVEFNDAPVGGTPSERYFIAKIMSVRETLDTANNVVKLNATLGINSNIVSVAASA